MTSEAGSRRATARSVLRAATASHHQRVDATFSAVAFGDAASYGAFLRAQAAAHLPVEEALAEGGIATIVPDWAARRRGGLIADDLAALGLDVPPAAGAIRFDTAAALLGALYVLEGSRLGGTLLKRSVAPGLPASFLGGGDSAAWRSLLALLDDKLGTAVARGRAIAAAGAVFALFEAAGRLHLKRPALTVEPTP
ncbi:biliverdin-producing heme oxygenase [uncultured Sphingomonas sp.]|uniref:biliverdin-producing heme oxygenase n=1 Tax=uncultured Sphingomonas sp. TaxID=158754 RepID=UPI0035C9E075